MHENVLALKPMGTNRYNFCYSTLQFHGGLMFIADTEIVFSVDQANYHSISFWTNLALAFNQFSLKTRQFQSFVAKTFVFPTLSSIF